MCVRFVQAPREPSACNNARLAPPSALVRCAMACSWRGSLYRTQPPHACRPPHLIEYCVCRMLMSYCSRCCVLCVHCSTLASRNRASMVRHQACVLSVSAFVWLNLPFVHHERIRVLFIIDSALTTAYQVATLQQSVCNVAAIGLQRCSNRFATLQQGGATLQQGGATLQQGGCNAARGLQRCSKVIAMLQQGRSCVVG